MPRYYLHIRNTDYMALDDEGTDLPDLNAARECALAAAREILAGLIRIGDEEWPESIVITDQSGTEIAAVPFRDALPAQRRG
jgi:uncharacterized protein DUF6894